MHDRRLPRRLAALLLALAALAGCSGGGTTMGGMMGGSTAAATATPAGDPGAASDADACRTAPAAPAEIDGWPSPGMVATTSVYPVIVSSELVCGRNRFIFTFLDANNTPQASPDRTAAVRFYDLGADPGNAVATVPGRFVWAIEGESGLYVAEIEFTEAGEWGADFATQAPGGEVERVRMRFEVRPSGSAVRVGDDAPSVRTPTLADVGGEVTRISSDTAPVAAFYETSVDAALAAGEPFVLVFATPAFCTSAQCGPLLQVVKRVVAADPGIRVINVEPYRLRWADGRLQPELDANGGLQATDATDAYGILTEPWVYVVDRTGIVTASFEGVLAEDELRAAIDAVR